MHRKSDVNVEHPSKKTTTDVIGTVTHRHSDLNVEQSRIEKNPPQTPPPHTIIKLLFLYGWVGSLLHLHFGG